MVLGRRRVLDDVVGDAAVSDFVLALPQLHGRHRGHRLDAFDVDLRQLLDEGEDGVELALQGLDLLLGNRDAREMRDAADGIGVDGHCGGSCARAYSRAPLPAPTGWNRIAPIAQSADISGMDAPNPSATPT